METVLILVALAALAVSGVTVAVMAARSRRPPLRLPYEHDIAATGEIEEFVPRPASPIDRSDEVLDLDPIEPPGRLEGPHRSGESR